MLMGVSPSVAGCDVKPLSAFLAGPVPLASALAVSAQSDKNNCVARAQPEGVVMDPSDQRYEELKRKWTDQFVEVNADWPELKRFAGIVGRVVTVNRNQKAVIDFQDGGWYDITASTDYLKILDPSTAKAKYDAKVNSAQPIPDKQGA
jgi:hypothetical protein